MHTQHKPLRSVLPCPLPSALYPPKLLPFQWPVSPWNLLELHIHFLPWLKMNVSQPLVRLSVSNTEVEHKSVLIITLCFYWGGGDKCRDQGWTEQILRSMVKDDQRSKVSVTLTSHAAHSCVCNINNTPRKFLYGTWTQRWTDYESSRSDYTTYYTTRLQIYFLFFIIILVFLTFHFVFVLLPWLLYFPGFNTVLVVVLALWKRG